MKNNTSVCWLMKFDRITFNQKNYIKVLYFLNQSLIQSNNYYNSSTNYQSYSEEDWENMSLSYSAIEEELAKHEYTDNELKEIGRMKGRCLGYLTKQSIKEIEKQLEDFGKELEGGIEGFLEVLSNICM